MNFLKASKSILGGGGGKKDEKTFSEQVIPKLFRPLKLDRNMKLIIKKKQNSLKGQKTILTASPAVTNVNIPSDLEMQNLYTEPQTHDTEVQQVPAISYHEVNTETIDFTSSGMRHVEGGWPKDVSASEEDQKLRFRKKLEKDEYFIHSVLQLSTRMEHCIRQNSSIDIYEGYFDEFTPPIVDEDQPVKTVNVIRDPLKGRMVTGLSFSPSPSMKIAAAYSSSVFMGLSQDTPKESFIWDINTSSKPELVLRGPSWLQSLEYNPKDQNVVGAGCNNGQVCYWDARTGGKPQGTTLLKVSHTDVVTSFAWLVHKTKYEFFTISIDGQVLWWDSRKLSEPTDKLRLIEQESGQLLTATCLEHEPSMPTKFMIGTEQGKVIACNRRARNPADKLGLCYVAHLSPVYSVQRNPVFQKNFLTVGDWTLKIWAEDFKESAILWTTPSSSQLRGGCWSPTRASIALTANCSGVLQIWDLLESWANPTTEVQIVDEGLEVVQIQENGQTVGAGSQRGTVALVRLPDRLCTPFDKHEKPAFTSLLDRETRRERVLEARHKEQRLREKARGAQLSNTKRDGVHVNQSLVAKAEEEYLKTVRQEIVMQMQSRMALESETIVEVTPAPEEDISSDLQNSVDIQNNSVSPNQLQPRSLSFGGADSDGVRSSSSGEPER